MHIEYDSQTSSHVSFQNKKLLLDHTHRDFIVDVELKKPSMACNDVMEAVSAIFEKEGISYS